MNMLCCCTTILYFYNEHQMHMWNDCLCCHILSGDFLIFNFYFLFLFRLFSTRKQNDLICSKPTWVHKVFVNGKAYFSCIDDIFVVNTNTRNLLWIPILVPLPVYRSVLQSQMNSWWRLQMQIFSALLAICAGNSTVPVNSPHKGQDAELWCFLWSAPE